jgi:DNA repair protein RadA/Sms
MSEKSNNQKRDASIKPCPRCNTPYSLKRSQCPKCGAFRITTTTEQPLDLSTSQVESIADIIKQGGEKAERYHVGIFDEAFGSEMGGGLVVCSTVLLGGKNGGGKSTMILQLADLIADGYDKSSLVVAREEDKGPIAERALRLQCKHLDKILIHPMTATTDIVAEILARKGNLGLVVLDSLSKFASTAEEQIELAGNLKLLSTTMRCPFVLISHINKDEDYAGFESLQHEVDVCMLIMPVKDKRSKEMRELSITKNRNGAANFELYYRMTGRGLSYTEGDQIADDEIDENDDDDLDTA